MFPPYNSTFVVRERDGREGRPRPRDDGRGQVQKGLTAEVMQELNARVDLDKKTPEAGGRRVPEGVGPHGLVTAWSPSGTTRARRAWRHARGGQRWSSAARWWPTPNGALRVLETSQAPAIYFPPEDVRMELLEPVSQADLLRVEGRGVVLRHRGGRAAGPRRRRGPTRSPSTPRYELIRDHLAFYPQRVDRCLLGDDVRGAQRGRLLRRLDHAATSRARSRARPARRAGRERAAELRGRRAAGARPAAAARPEEWLRCETPEQVADAIASMAVRGAPAIGLAAAYGAGAGARRARALGEEVRGRPGRGRRGCWAPPARPPSNLRLGARARAGASAGGATRSEVARRGAGALSSSRPTGRCRSWARSASRPATARSPTATPGPLATGGYGTALGVLRAGETVGGTCG